MNRLRQRKLIARENRQASLHSQGMTVEKTVIKVPQPKVLEKKEIVKVKEKSIPVVAVVVKRGPGRPPKKATDKNIERRESKSLTVRSKGKKK